MKPFYIVDIGGTSIKFGISNISAQEPLFQIQTPQNRTDIINTICEAINDFDTSFQSQNQIDTVMVSCPGLINEDGFVEKALYIDLSGVDLKGVLEEKLCRKIKVFNDAKVQTIGRFVHKKALLYMCIGTAVGGGFCSEQGLFSGGHGKSCEFGHIVIKNCNNKCFCGREGCLDTIISGKAMLSQLGDDWWERVSAPSVEEYIKYAAKALCESLESLALLFDPDEICVCGNICKVDLFRQQAENLWKNNKWSTARLDLRTDTWPFVYKGTSRLYESENLYIRHF